MSDLRTGRQVRPKRHYLASEGKYAVTHVGVKSAAKLAAVVSIVMTIALVVAIGLSYLLLKEMGALDAAQIGLEMANVSFQPTVVQVLLAVAVLFGMNVLTGVLVSVIGTIVYNLCADLSGGLVVRVGSDR